MVREFEDACYALKVGEHTPVPVRTQFGYHVVKVTGRQPNKGAVRVSHILRRFAESLEDTAVVRDSAWAIHGLLKSGMDFAQAAARYSQDPRSSQNGGDIGLFERGRVPPAIEELFYRTPVDSVTEPFAMPYGYHIFRITGVKGIPLFGEIEKELRQQYQQTRYQADYRDYLQNLKKQHRLNVDAIALHDLSQAFDSTKTPEVEMWSDTLTADLRRRILFSCEDHKWTVDDFVSHVNAADEFKSSLLNAKNVEEIVERMSEAKVLEEHARGVPDVYSAFGKLMHEYQDGILLYRIEQDEIWKKVVVNDSLLCIFYEENKANYRWPERVDFAEIFITSDSLAKVAYEEIRAGKDFGKMAEDYTVRQGYKEKKGVWGLQPNSLNEVTQYAASLPVDSVAPPLRHSSGWSIVKTLAKDSSRVKSFEEAKPELVGAYQEHASKIRGQEWVSTLMTKYPVRLNKELLSTAFTRRRVATQ